MSPGVAAGMMQAGVAPIYPADAKAKNLEGRVTLRAIIDKSGTVQNLTVLTATDPIFVQAAIDAVHRWKYRPYLLNGEPVDVDTRITVNFTMGKQSKH